MLDWTLSTIVWLLRTVWNGVVGFGKRRPEVVVLAVIAVVRSLGTTVQTGWAGVLFSFGRAKKVLEPGFHPLVPIVQRVRQTPIRSITLDLPRQRVTTADGLVYDVHTSIVYRVEDPIRALTGVQDVRQGVLDLVPLLVAALIREQTQATLGDRKHLDTELTARACQALARWGLTVEQAGLSTIAPTRHTVRLTQLSARIGERARLVRGQCAAGVEVTLAVALVAHGRAPRGHSAARYHRHRRAVGKRAAPARLRVVLPEGAALTVNDLPAPAAGSQTYETPNLRLGVKYAYTLAAFVYRGGRLETVTSRVYASAGKLITVDFTGPAAPFVTVQKLETPGPTEAGNV